MRIARLWCFVCLCVWTAGCSGSSERIAGWYVTRTIASYFDLRSEQKAELRTQVDAVIVEARRSELPRLISLLRETRAAIHDGLDEAKLSYLQRRYDERLDAAVDGLTPKVAPMLAQLDDHQLDHFVARAREDIHDQYEDLDQPPAKQAAKLEKRALKVVEDFVGDLSDEQEEAVRQLIRKLPNERALQYRNANDNLSHFRAFMAGHPDGPRIAAELRAMWAHRYDRLGPGHDKSARRAQQARWMLDVYRLTTGAQRAHAEEELSDRIRSLKRWVLPG